MHAHTPTQPSAHGDHAQPGVAARPWLAMVLLLASMAAGAAEPAANAQEAGGAGRATEAGRSAGAERYHPVPSKPTIGRIFFSPAERRSRRGEGMATAPARTEPDALGGPVEGRGASEDLVVVNGALSSSTQGRAVWLNGRVVENAARDKAAWTDRNGNVWLMNGDRGTRLVRPGQSLDRSSGRIEDLLPPGAVVRR